MLVSYIVDVNELGKFVVGVACQKEKDARVDNEKILQTYLLLIYGQV